MVEFISCLIAFIIVDGIPWLLEKNKENHEDDDEY